VTPSSEWLPRTAIGINRTRIPPQQYSQHTSPSKRDNIPPQSTTARTLKIIRIPSHPTSPINQPTHHPLPPPLPPPLPAPNPMHQTPTLPLLHLHLPTHPRLQRHSLPVSAHKLYQQPLLHTPLPAKQLRSIPRREAERGVERDEICKLREKSKPTVFRSLNGKRG